MLHIKLKKALIVVHVDHLKLDLGTVPLAWANSYIVCIEKNNPDCITPFKKKY
jgi:hypothetical protein